MAKAAVEVGVRRVSPRKRLACFAAGLVVLQLLLIAVLDPDPGYQVLVIGFFLGSIYGHTSLSAAWTALGPGPLTLRLAGGLIWICLLPLAIALSAGGPPDGIVFLIGLCLLGQWLLMQFPFWILVAGYGLRLRHASELSQISERHERQFGIGQLIMVTAIVGVFLGIGRALVLTFGDSFDVVGREGPAFIFLGIAAAVLTLPLVLAGVMRRHALAGVALTLIFMGMVTLVEMPLLAAFHSGPGPNSGHFVTINVFTTLTVLAMASIVRFCGFGLSRAGQQQTV